MQRFFVSEESLAEGATVELTGLQHQLRRVLRLAPGDEVLLLDGRGNEYVTELVEVSERRAAGRLGPARPAAAEPNIRLTLYQCALKGDKLAWVLQKGTELGVSRFVPVISERTIVRPAAKLVRKYDRWRSIVREAAEQSGRGRLPELAQPMTWEEALQDKATRAEGQREGAGGQTVRFLPWEGAAGGDSLAEAAGRLAGPGDALLRVDLAIGPEGGISEREVAQAQAQGWRIVSMGPRILRSETAALAAIAITMSALGEMAHTTRAE